MDNIMDHVLMIPTVLYIALWRRSRRRWEVSEEANKSIRDMFDNCDLCFCEVR